MKRYAILLLALAGAIPAVRADVIARKDPADPQTIVMQNECLALRIDLTRGAHVVSYRYKGFDDAEIVFDYQTENGGLFKDLWYAQGWPGEFDKRTNDAEIAKAGPEEAVVKTWTKSTGAYGNKLNPDLANILLVKTFSLKKGERTLTVSYELTNQDQKGKRPAFWSQHAADLDGTRKHNTYWRPTLRGVDCLEYGQELTANGYWYAVPVTAGWNGCTDRKLKRGIMFLMDYNDLLQVYDNWGANTTEWMYDDVAIPAGKTWRTVMRLIPTEGFAGYTYGGEELVGYFEAHEGAGGLRVEHTLSAAARELKEVSVQTLVRGIRSPWEAKAEPFQVDRLGWAPLARSVSVPATGPMPCVVEVTVTARNADGKPLSIRYADYVGGNAGRNADLVTLEPLYAFPAPEKQKQYLKPDRIALQHASPPRILFIRGLWAEFQGIDEALKQLGDVTVVDGWMKKTALGETAGNFPASYEDLLAYDVIILGNVSGPMISGVGQEMLADYLKAGGGVLMLSGDRTYGQGGFSNTNFTRLMPVVCGQESDYGPLKTPSRLAVKGNHPVTRGCALTADAVVLYTHTLKASAQAVTAVALEDGTPAVILSGDDACRFAAVAVLPFGEAPAGKRLYYQSQEWQTLMANTLKWLMRRM